MCFREVYHGLRWGNDKRFFAPMAIAPCGNVFVGDSVEIAFLESHQSAMFSSLFVR